MLLQTLILRMVQGLVIKDMLSSYRPGARTGGGWIKVNTVL